METTKRLVVLMDGTGSTLQSILDATRLETLDAEVVAVFSHEPWCYGLLRAEREGVPALLHDLADYRFGGKSESEYVADLAERIESFEPDLVVLAGWNLPLNEEFFRRFANRVINLHSGLPGQFPIFDPYGQNPASRAYEAYSAGLIREAHVSVQLFSERETLARIIAQQPVPIYEFDHLGDLEERMNRVQQELLVNTLRLLLRETGDPTSSQ
ncbi:MAG: formyltransferase family protein [Ardenticatenaceae bacterium]